MNKSISHDSNETDHLQIVYNRLNVIFIVADWCKSPLP